MSALMGGQNPSFREVEALQVKRSFIKEQYEEFFGKYDVMLCPVVPIPAFEHSSTPSDDRVYTGKGIPDFNVVSLLFWPGMIIVADLPSTVVPIGRTPGGLPCGIQIVAPAFHDLTS